MTMQHAKVFVTYYQSHHIQFKIDVLSIKVH